MMDTEKEVNQVIGELQSGRGSSLYGALIMLRTTLIKSRSAISQLVQLGAVKLLIQLLEDHRRHVNQTKTTDIVMSILANLCMEEDVREKVVSCGGVSVIARVTLSSEQESIQNRGVRALANLAQDESNCQKILGMEVPAFVAKRLMESEDVECRSTFCRALQLFGQTSKGVKRLVEDTQAVQALAALLKLDNRKLALKSLRILSEFIAICCCPSFTGQILAANVLEELVTLADDEDSSAASYSLSIVLRLCEQELMRPALGSAGVISLLVKLMSSERAVVSKVAMLNALCLCTKEAVNRIKIRDAGGLEVLLSALKERSSKTPREAQFSMLYDRIISSLVNFLYNDDCLGKLLELGLVASLVEHLKRCCQFTFTVEDLRQEVRSLAYATEFGVSLKEENKLSTDVASCSFTDVGEKKPEAAEDIDIPDSPRIVAEDQLNKEDMKVCGEEVDPLIIDSSIMTDSEGMVVNADYEKVGSPCPDSVVELPQPPTSVSRNTFSINSPTYQAETSWKLEDYTTGVTCKTFHQQPHAQTLTPPYLPPYSANIEGTAQAPYSPLSAGASYYSPTQSSPSHSAALSPLQSLSPNSPASSSISNQASPTWSYTSSEQLSPVYPGAAFSPFHNSASQSSRSSFSQNQFSPLSNAFPISPLHSPADRNTQSPVFSSQQTDQPASQESSLPYFERPLDSPGNVGQYGRDDHVLTTSTDTSKIKFSIVPLSQDSVISGTPVYSASEDDDDDDDHNDSRDESLVSREQCTPATIDNQSETINDQRQPVRVLLANKSGNPEDSTCSSQQDSGNVQNESTDTNKVPGETPDTSPKRRKLNDDSYAPGDVTEICDQIEPEHIVKRISKTSRHSSIGFIPSSSNDDEVSADTTQYPCVTVSSSFSSFEQSSDISSLESNKDIMSTERKSGKAGLEASVSSTEQNVSVVQKGKNVTFQRMASYPGKRKLPAMQTVGFRRFLSSSVSPTARHGTSPLAVRSPVSIHGASPLISDSPYRSPYSEFTPSPKVSQEDPRRILGTSTYTKRTRSTEGIAERSPRDAGSSASQEQVFSTREGNDANGNSTRDENSGAIPDVAPNIRPDSEARVKKIMRTTESNILILLARISQKTNPTQYLVEAPVMSCLLGYVGTAPNPIKRCCRILNRLCSNPHCFDRLILLQVPVLIVRSLFLEEDGTFPTVLLGSEGSSRHFSDLLPSSQGSEGSCSQASEFGRKIDFEFGGDAYSRMTSRNQASSLGALFREGPSLSVDSQSARDSLGGGGDVYEMGTVRTEARVQIGLGLMKALGAVAMSRYGEGEIQHLLTLHSVMDKLACIVSVLHMTVGWGHFTRRQFILKYNLWDKVLPSLFIPDGPVIREAIVVALSLNVHLDNPAKLVKEIVRLPVCRNLEQGAGQGSGLSPVASECCGDSFKSGQENVKMAVATLSLKKNGAPSQCEQHDVSFLSSNTGSMVERAPRDSEAERPTDSEVEFDSGPWRECFYRNMAHMHDIHFVVHDGDTVHRLSVCREILRQKSEMFAAMLGGSYVESKKSEIVISDVNRAGFEFIIHYLHGCSSGCSVIDSLCLPKSDSESVVLDGAVTSGGDSDSSEREKPQSILQVNNLENQHQRDMANNCDNVGSSDRFKSKTKENKNSVPVCEGHELDGMKTEFNTETHTVLDSPALLCVDAQEEKEESYMSPLLDFSESQDSLSLLTLEDDTKAGTSHASRKLNFHKPSSEDRKKTEDTGTGIEGGETQSSPPVHADKRGSGVGELLSCCADILELADRFLLSDLMDYITSVLSHVCLCPQTAVDVFHLACFYKLDQLAVDCMREMLLSNVPRCGTAAVFVELAEDGYREHAEAALRQLLNSIHSS